MRISRSFNAAFVRPILCGYLVAVSVAATIIACYPDVCDPAKDPTQCQCPPGVCGPYPTPMPPPPVRAVRATTTTDDAGAR